MSTTIENRFYLRHKQLIHESFWRFCTFNVEALKAIENHVDFSCLSRNRQTRWDEEFVSSFGAKLDLGQLISWNPGMIQWTDKLLLRYFKRLPNGFAACEQLPWHLNLLEMFQGDSLFTSGACANPTYPWSLDQIETLQNWKREHGGTRDIIAWDGLCSNPSIRWTVDLLERYSQHLRLPSLANNPNGLTNAALDWMSKTLQTHQDFKWFWTNLCSNRGMKWDEESIARWEVNLNLGVMARNPSVRWTESLIKRFEDKWTWYEDDMDFRGNRCYDTRCGLSSNRGLPWKEDILEKFQNRWDFSGLSKNESIIWTRDLIDAYKTNWNWEWLSMNAALPWSESLLSNYTDKWNWEAISVNPGIHWTEKMLAEFDDRLNWSEISDNENIFRTSGDTDPNDKHFLLNLADSPYDDSIIFCLSGVPHLPWNLEFVDRKLEEGKLKEGDLARNEGFWTHIVQPHFSERLLRDGSAISK